MGSCVMCARDAACNSARRRRRLRYPSLQAKEGFLPKDLSPENYERRNIYLFTYRTFSAAKLTRTPLHELSMPRRH